MHDSHASRDRADRVLNESLESLLVSGGDDMLIQLAVRDTDHLRSLVLSEIASLEAVVDETTSLIFEHRAKPELPNLIPEDD